MKKQIYIPRLFDNILNFALRSKGAVLVVGPKSCGKSTTSKRLAKTVIDLTDQDASVQQIALAKVSPTKFLNQGEKPILIDEWQEVSFIWNSIKNEVDKISSFGQYILTGSVTDKTFFDNNINSNRHTGTARIVKKIMRPMSLFESGDSNGNVSLLALKDGKFKPTTSSKTIDDYAFLICRGGWPLSINKEKDVALQQSIDFYEGLVSEDIFSLRDIPLRKDEQCARKLMRSYSRAISTQTADKVIMDDVASSRETFDIKTFNKYILALERLYVIDELEAWNPNLRSKIAIREKSTRHFVDPSIAAAALGTSPNSLFKDIKTFGLLFESLAIRDLKIYCDSFGAKIYHYRDKTDREADAVIYFKDGSWALIEVKLGDKKDIDDAAKKLLKISRDIDERKTGSPAFLMIITKNNVAIKRDDGIYEVPLGCLKP